MVPGRVRRVLEDLLPWYDRAEEKRHDERSEYIHERSIEVRVANEIAVEIGKAEIVKGDRIRDAYRAVDERLHR